MTNIVILGATSAIARAVADRFVNGASFVLVARDAERLKAIAADLTIRGARAAHVVQADLAEMSDHVRVVHEACAAMPAIDLVLIAHGILPDQARCDADVDYAMATWMLNADSVVSLMHRFVNMLIEQGRGTAVVISSVAGDRGRASNYTYGAAKAAVSAYASGLRTRAAAHGVKVITVKPGIVDTPMTAHLKKTRLFASTEVVAGDIERAIARGSSTVYTPWFWRPIMSVIKALPERIVGNLRA